MPSGAVISAPSPPIPPALPTAAARPTGQAPAIGACKIGTRRPKRRQNSSARWRGLVLDGMVLRLDLPDIEIHCDRIPAAEQHADMLAGSRRVPACQQRRKARRATRLDDNPQYLPKDFLRLPDRIVRHEDDALDKLPSDGKNQLSDLARRQRIGRYPAGVGIDWPSGLDRPGQRRGGFGLDPDHPDLATEPGGDSGDQSAAADRDKQRVEVWRLFLHLQPDRALPEQRLGLVERMDRERPRLGCPGFARAQGVGVALAND